MSSLYQPTGLQMQGVRANAPYQGAITRYNLTTNNTVAIAKGDPVALVTGSITAVAANPASGTLSANTPIGVVVGFEYQDPNRGFVCTPLLVANAVSSALLTNITVLVADEPTERFQIQCNGPVASSFVGGTVQMGGFNADSAQFKVSRVFADSATLSTATGTQALRILQIDPGTDNAPGDAFTRIWVTWNNAVHYLSQAGSH